MPKTLYFKPCFEVAWAPVDTGVYQAGVEAFEGLVELLRSWQVPSSRNRGVFSTWGEQFALLDGCIVVRDEPEGDYSEPIFGYAAHGTMVVQLLCKASGIDVPSWLTDPPHHGLEELQRILAWQLEYARPTLEARLGPLSHVQAINDFGAVRDHLADENGKALPPSGATLPMNIIASASGQPSDVTDLDEGFVERIRTARFFGLYRSEDGLLHVGGCPKFIYGAARVIKDIPVSEAESSLCLACFSTVITFLREVLDPTESDHPVETVQLVRFRAELKGPSAEYLQLHHIIRYAVRPWRVVATHGEIDPGGGWTFVPLGGDLELGEVPSGVARAIGRALEVFVAGGTTVSYRLD